MKAERWDALVALARTQHALVGVDQARAIGIRADSLQRAIDAKLLTAPRRGVVRLAGAPPSRWEDVMAACLATGAGSVASHRSAGLLHGLAVTPPAQPEVLSAAKATEELLGAGRHRTRRLFAEHCTRVWNVPCTTIERTIIDLAASASAFALAALIDDADRRGLCRPADIDLCLCQLTTRGRTGVARLRAVLVDRVGGSTALEARWLRHIREAALPAPELQFQLVLRNRVLLLDVAWPAMRVALEVDGWDAHRTRGAFDTDASRGNLLLEAGWRVAHATSKSEPSLVTAQLRRLLAA